MARIRSIHPGLFTDEEFMELTETCPAASVLLIGLWCECDDDGVFDWKPRTLNARYISSSSQDIETLLGELERTGFIRRFEVDGKTYGAAKNFQRWQKPQKPKRRGLVPDALLEYVGADDTDTGPVQYQSDTGTGISSTREEGRGRVEEEESESSLRSESSDPPPGEGDPDPPPSKPGSPAKPKTTEARFEEFYREYPRHEGKGAARKAYRKARQIAGHDELVAGAKRARRAYADRERRFVPLPATWLNQERWNDEHAGTSGNGHDPPRVDLSGMDDEQVQEAALRLWRKSGVWPEWGGPKPEDI